MNKNLLKIAGIIAIILGIFACLTFFGIIIGLPMVIGGNKMREYAEMDNQTIKQNKENILIWAIVFMFICQISGILLLIFYLTMDEAKKGMSQYDELQRLKELYDNKVITKEEFEAKKEQILK